MTRAKKTLPTTAACEFCGKANKRDRQHLWAQWYSRWLVNAGVISKGTLIEAKWGDGVTFMPAGKGKKINLTVIRQCQKCNTGWMRDLENAARSVLEPDLLLVGPRVETKTLDWMQQLDLAAFASLMATTFEGAGTRTPRKSFYTADERYWLSQLGIPPARTTIWLARQHQSSPYLAWACETDLSWERPTLWPAEKGKPAHSSVRGYTLTFTIGLTVFQILSHHWYPDAGGFFPPIQIHRGPWAEAALQIWPVVADQRVPPKQVFDEAGLQTLADRWTPPEALAAIKAAEPTK